MARSQSATTTDHDAIRRWAEARGGKPMRVKGTASGGSEMIRLGFPGAPGSDTADLEEISWDEWFRQFDENDLALLYEEETTDGQRSNFNKLVRRDGDG